MDFFDKLGGIAKTIGDKTVDVAKNIGDRTSDAIETQKIKNKIAGERRGFEDQMKLIGQYFYEKHLRGEAMEEDILPYLTKAQEHAANIEQAKAEIEALKEDMPSK